MHIILLLINACNFFYLRSLHVRLKYNNTILNVGNKDTEISISAIVGQFQFLISHGGAGGQ